MNYAVGVDLGTTFTAAAVRRDGERPEVVQLGNRGASIPTAVFLREDETILTGDAALRRGLAEPGRVAREFKRRFGDPTPLLLGGVPLSADVLTGRMLRATLDPVAEREGAPAEVVAVCHPANWGPYKLDLLDQACRRAGLDDAVLISEPEAAAVHYAAQERIDPGAVVAVYDLGGGTFDAAVLRRTEDGFEVLGTPEGIERLGGIDFDEAVVGRVREAIGDAVATLDIEDPATLAALARLREECVAAKEALSSDTDATVPVVLPGVTTEVRVTRVEFESLIRVPVAETIESLRRALSGAGVGADDLAAVLLVGGSSRIPMVAEMVGAELGRPVAVDADPKHVVALGAARIAADRAGVRGAPAAAPPPPAPPPAAAPPPPAAAAPAASPRPVRPSSSALLPPGAAPPPAGPRPGASRPVRPGRRRVIGAAVALLVLVALAVVALLALGGDEGGGAAFVSECPPAGDPAVCITDVRFDGEDLAVEFTDHDVDLGGDLVPIFFLTDVSADEAGSVSQRTGDWRAWGADSPFQGQNDAGQEGFTSGDVTDAQTAVCVLIGNPSGQVASGTGNCAGLPS